MKNLILFLIPFALFSQENCNYYKIIGETDRFEACTMFEKRRNLNLHQFSKENMELLDENIEKFPEYAPPYREKAATYIKAGDFVNWKINIDKAVKYDPEGYLGIRAGLKAKFFADYQGAIEDIDSLASITKYDLGYTHNGDYHLNILKSICYSQLGKKEKAIEIFEKQLAHEDHLLGLYDYYQLGVTYFELNNYEKAIEALGKQLKENENAETQYYIAQSYKKMNQLTDYKQHKQKAIELYQNGVIMRDPYNEHINKVYWETILAD